MNHFNLRVEFMLVVSSDPRASPIWSLGFYPLMKIYRYIIGFDVFFKKIVFIPMQTCQFSFNFSAHETGQLHEGDIILEVVIFNMNCNLTAVLWPNGINFGWKIITICEQYNQCEWEKIQLEWDIALPIIIKVIIFVCCTSLPLSYQTQVNFEIILCWHALLSPNP